MKLEMKTGFAVMLLILFIVCIFCVGWVGVAGAVELPSTPTLAPTMDPWDDIVYPTPMATPDWKPGDYRFEIYLPIVIQQKTIISWATPTLAPTPTRVGEN